MKSFDDLISVYESDHKTFNFLGISVVMIALPLMLGTTDNIFLILVLFTGLILFFYSALRHWGKAFYYAILIAACAAVSLISWFIKGDLGEDAAMTLGMISFTAIIAGTIGIFNFARGRSRFLYIAAALSIVSIPVYLVSLPPPPLPEYVSPFSEGLTTGIIFFISIVLLMAGYFDRNDKRVIKIILFCVLVTLLVLGSWGLIGPALEPAKIPDGWKFSSRIYAIILLVITFLVFLSVRQTTGSAGNTSSEG